MKYSPLPLEKTCLALVFATQKLRHHYIICYVGPCSKKNARMDPLKYLFEKPALTVAIAFIFSEFEISYVTQKA